MDEDDADADVGPPILEVVVKMDETEAIFACELAVAADWGWCAEGGFWA